MPSRGIRPPALRLKAVHNLGDLADTWDELVERQDLPSPFLKSWWLDNVAVGTPQILCFYDNETLVGGAAFETSQLGFGPMKVERVTSLGQGVLAPDHLDVIYAAKMQRQVVQDVLDWLRRPGSRIIDLDGLAAEGALAASLRRYEIDRTVAPFATLKADAPSYFVERPGKLRSTIKRGRNRFAKQDVATTRVDEANADGLSEALDSLAELHDGRWSDQSRFLDAFDRFRDAAMVGAMSGDVVIHQLNGPSAGVVAIEVDLIAGGRACFYQAGRRTEREWRGCGTVLRADIIDSISTSGITEYDMLRGAEPYKADWATAERELVRVRFGVGLVGRPAAAGMNAWKALQPGVFRAWTTVKRWISRVPLPQRREPRIEM